MRPHITVIRRHELLQIHNEIHLLRKSATKMFGSKEEEAVRRKSILSFGSKIRISFQI